MTVKKTRTFWVRLGIAVMGAVVLAFGTGFVTALTAIDAPAASSGAACAQPSGTTRMAAADGGTVVPAAAPGAAAGPAAAADGSATGAGATGAGTPAAGGTGDAAAAAPPGAAGGAEPAAADAAGDNAPAPDGNGSMAGAGAAPAPGGAANADGTGSPAGGAGNGAGGNDAGGNGTGSGSNTGGGQGAPDAAPQLDLPPVQTAMSFGQVPPPGGNGAAAAGGNGNGGTGGGAAAPAHYAMQFGSFSDQDRANEMLAALQARGVQAHVAVEHDDNGRAWYNVRSAAYRDRLTAEQLAVELRARDGLTSLVVAEAAHAQ